METTQPLRGEGQVRRAELRHRKVAGVKEAVPRQPKPTTNNNDGGGVASLCRHLREGASAARAGRRREGGAQGA